MGKKSESKKVPVPELMVILLILAIALISILSLLEPLTNPLDLHTMFNW